MNSLRKINFNAGPSALPDDVLAQASEAVIEYNKSGMSILEIPHRGKEFDAILQESFALVRELCQIDDDYEVLWMHGGGRTQFCMIPMNFLGEEDSAGYIDSGHWAEQALEAAAFYGDVQVLTSSKDVNYSRLPEWPSNIPKQLAYLHFTTNNTIYGTQWHQIPKTHVPLIADMSSDIFYKKQSYNHYDMFYAAAQKNMGPAGVTLVVIRKDMLDRIDRDLPSMFNYKAHVNSRSLLNTPPVFAIYASLLMLRWTKQKGLDIVEKENILKAQMLYNELDRNSMFEPTVKHKPDRSLMNVCFTAANNADENAFLDFCSARNITGIKGHRFVGGFRVSIYNGVTVTAVNALVEAMKEFEASKK
ncbi:MAG TPA: 3-phosphoserine/phosphohydroxythreonine transaminase [Flavipsychrobacter sp.]|nr:3-phosphoserine/phosphohydroxythreonine transaminase [Flavipsychrobacter sp.]